MFNRVVKALAYTFLSISDPIEKKHWFLTPEQHAIEFLIMNTFYLITMYLGYKLLKRNQIINKNRPLMVKDIGSIINYILAAILIINVILNLIYKCVRGWRVVFFMLQPCHIVSSIYAYCLLTPNYGKGREVFKISVYYIFVTVLALAAPDTVDLTLPFEVHNFFIQHYALLLAPITLQMYRYDIKFEWSYALISESLIGLAHFVVFEICSFFSGTNINYMLFPPPLGDFDYLIQETYRVVIGGLIFLVSLFFGYLAIIIGSKLRSVFLIKTTKNKIK
ncbi:hypothetical protein DICPUDRAFT_83165 [Dictyostelium purpureum]|uniref:Transmembrane protein n=1 Tax=Dictyostelium purpureum TaxID=5786 RepID=F0ZYR0_DICPU|nr:uncharacterized protein DICPUDRAFT_83165 [Dictyostelium purpureum]EGC30923.1 hypothetical protein DICPUDRAFT_83165 [Dictyostelium purpureum]|eukprot:XP_003292552.1 hypothetical protein DICPUDRAFT_83165 [Dictyostelium purpureum]